MEIRYSYAPVPTVRRFAQSNAFVRGLLGPFGCLPGDTEFLTPFGWKRIDAYSDSDLVLQWTPDGATEFVYPESYVRQPATAGFFEFDSGSLVMALSPSHRVPHYDWKGAFAVKTAAQIASRPSKRTIPTTFKAPQTEWKLGLSDDMIRFAVMMHADGHYPKQGRKAQVCVRKAHKKERVRQLLTALGVEWTESVYPKRPTELTFRFEPPYRGKRFTGGWWWASEAQLRVIVDEVTHWDGLYDHDEIRFFTTVKEDADFIQYAAHATGRRAAIHKTAKANDAWVDCYSVNIRVGDSHKNRAQVRVDHTQIRKLAGAEEFCFVVPSTFFVARYRDTIFVTGNSGKSSGCVFELVRRAQAQKPMADGIRRTRWVVIRNTYRQLHDTTMATMHQWLPPHVFGEYRASEEKLLVKALPECEVEILYRALDRPDHIGNLLSLELTGAWLNEAREMPKTIVDALEGRVGRFPAQRDGGPTWYGVFMDTNPPDTDSWWYKRFEEYPQTEAGAEALARYEAEYGRPLQEVFRQPSGLAADAENLANLPKGYYKTIAAGKDREWIRVYVEGQYGFVIDGRPVFPEYNDSVHCSEAAEPLKGEPLYRGWDFGLTPACVFAQKNRFGQFVVFDELTSDSMGVDAFGDEVLDHCAKRWSRRELGWEPEWYDIGDPAGQQRAQTDERTCFQILAAKGVQVEPGLQTTAIRLESVRKPLSILRGGRPGFLLHPRCKTLRKGFMGAYQYRRMNTVKERYTEKPDKTEVSHPHDALQYIATILFGEGLTTEKPRTREAGVWAADGDEASVDRGSRDRVTGY